MMEYSTNFVSSISATTLLTGVVPLDNCGLIHVKFLHDIWLGKFRHPKVSLNRTLKKQEACSSKTVITTYKITKWYNAEDNLNSHCHKNLKSHHNLAFTWHMYALNSLMMMIYENMLPLKNKKKNTVNSDIH
jgi:hypothetical protein